MDEHTAYDLKYSGSCENFLKLIASEGYTESQGPAGTRAIHYRHNSRKDSHEFLVGWLARTRLFIENTNDEFESADAYLEKYAIARLEELARDFDVEKELSPRLKNREKSNLKKQP